MTRRKKLGGKKPKRRRPSDLRCKLSGQSIETESNPISALPLWSHEQDLHAIVPGTPDADTFERMTEIYQQKIRQSPLWDQMVREFGLEKAEQLLKQCRAEPG